MDTEKLIILDESNITVEIANLTENEIEKFDSYVNICDQIENHHQLFLASIFNLKILRSLFTLSNGDTVVRNNDINIDIDDKIAINALVLNYISSCKTLIESIEAFEGKTSSFRSFTSNIYDSNFYYRFLLQIRNLSQHGQLPISYNNDNNKYCFDLHQLINTPHYTWNANVKKQVEKISEEIITKAKTTPRLALTLALASFTVNVVQIYNYYLSLKKEELKTCRNSIEIIVKEKPGIITTYPDNLLEVIFYKVTDGNAHAIPYNENPINLIDKHIRYVTQIQSEEDSAYDDLQSHTQFVNLD